MIPNLWHPETVYLNTASFGLPPDPAWEALQTAQEDWRAGRVSWEHWTAVTDRTRAQFATLVGARPEQVVVGANVSGLISQVAVAIPDGSRVLAPEPEFVSLLFPFLAQAERGVTVDVVPLDRLASAVDASVDVVAVSAVQSSTGEVAALDDIAAAARVLRRPDRDRRDARDRVAAAGRDEVRRRGVRRLQVADEPARDGVHGAVGAPGVAADAAPGRLVRGRRSR